MDTEEYMYYAYVLYNTVDNEFYSGYSANLKNRIHDHLYGKVESTKGKKMILIFYEAFYSQEDAKRREIYFKTTKGKRTLKLMLKESLMLV